MGAQSVHFIRSTGETARPLRWDGSCLWTRKHQLWHRGFLKEPLKPDVLSSLFHRYKNQVYNCKLLSFRMHVLDIYWLRPGQCIKPVVSCKNSILVQKSNYNTWWGRNLKNIFEPWNQRLNRFVLSLRAPVSQGQQVLFVENNYPQVFPFPIDYSGSGHM